MDAQVNVGSLVRAIADSEITAAVAESVATFEECATMILKSFLASPPTPSQTQGIEEQLHEMLGEVGRKLVQWLFSQLEPRSIRCPAPFRTANNSIGDCLTKRFERISSHGSAGSH